MIIIVYEIPLKYWPRFVLYYHMADGNNPPFLEIGKFTNLIIIKVFKMIEKNPAGLFEPTSSWCGLFLEEIEIESTFWNISF